jgi:hypothetical protein
LTSSQKFSVSLLISVLAFGVFSVLVLSGRFGFIEAKFYQPAVRRPIEQKINGLSEQEKQYNQILIDRFTSFACDEAVLSFSKTESTDAEVKERSASLARLFSSSPYLTGIRIIDSNGRKLHYSTFEYDRKKQDNKKIIYEDYQNIVKQSDEISYEKLNCPQEKKYRVYLDSNRKRIVYSLPFSGKDNSGKIAQTGTAVFYCDTEDFTRYLHSKNLITLTEKESSEFVFDSVNGTGGYVFGLPYRNLELSKSGIEVLKETVIQKAREVVKLNTFETVEETISLSGTYRILDKVSGQSDDIQQDNSEEYSKDSAYSEKDEALKTEHEFVVFIKNINPGEETPVYLALVYDSNLFEITTGIRVLLLTLLFITIFLVVFLIFNLRHDDMVVITDRIRRFQLAFITEYVNRNDENLKSPGEYLLSRRQELSDEIRKSLGRRGRKHSKEVDKLLERNWSEILTGLGVSSGMQALPKASVDSAELRSILEEILGSGKIKIAAASVVTGGSEKGIVEKAEKAAPSAPVEAVEEIEEAADAEAVEELDDVEEIEEVTEAEAVEEVEELEDAEAVEEAADAEAVEELDDVEEIEEVSEAEAVEDAEELEDAEAVEEAADAEAVEELDDVEEIEEVTEAEAVEETEELEDAEVVEEAADAESVEELDDVEEIEEVTEAESVEEAEELEDAETVEEAADAEAVEELDDVEEIEEVTEAEAVEEAEELEDAEPVEEAEDVVEAESAEDVGLDEFMEESPVPLSAAESDDNEGLEEEMDFGSPVHEVAPDPEDDKLVENFSAAPIDFSFLDDEDIRSGDDDEDAEPSLDDIEEGEQERVVSEEAAVEAISLVAAESDETDESVEIAAENAVEVSAESAEQDEGLEILPDPQDSHPFLFTTFGANNNNITDLPPDNTDAIVEDADGLFHIEGRPVSGDVKLDADLKKLVEAVLK